MSKQKNVFGENLIECSVNPLTGYFRDGCCNTDSSDLGLHIVCVEVSEQFLEFSKSRGNDLSIPNPDVEFPGLKPGDRWCLCAARWQEAYENNMAPRVVLESTHRRAMEIVSLETMREFAVDQ